MRTLSLRWPLAVVAVAGMLLASGCMWGVVRDQNTGLPIHGAQVQVTDSNGVTHATTSDSNGLYSFDIANGSIPAAGPGTARVDAGGYTQFVGTMPIDYNDNPNASGANFSSFWEVANFSMSPTLPPQLPTADLAVIDLYADALPVGNVWAVVQNNGPDALDGVTVTLNCTDESTDRAAGTKASSTKSISVTASAGPGGTMPIDTGIGINTGPSWYSISCTVTGDVNDGNAANNSYTKIIPTPTGDIVLEDILLNFSTNEMGLRISANGLSGTFTLRIYVDGVLTVSQAQSLPAGSQVFWTGYVFTGTHSVHAEVDPENKYPETNELNNMLDRTCWAASHNCG